MVLYSLLHFFAAENQKFPGAGKALTLQLCLFK